LLVDELGGGLTAVRHNEVVLVEVRGHNDSEYNPAQQTDQQPYGERLPHRIALPEYRPAFLAGGNLLQRVVKSRAVRLTDDGWLSFDPTEDEPVLLVQVIAGSIADLNRQDAAIVELHGGTLECHRCGTWDDCRHAEQVAAHLDPSEG
jgi:hypothetical protein